MSENENKNIPDTAPDAEQGDYYSRAEADREESGRPRRSGVGCLPTMSFVLLLLGISVLISSFAILAANDVFALSKAQAEATVTIEQDDSLRDVSKMLSDAGIINYPGLFRLFAGLTDMAHKIAPGDYTLSSAMDYRTILTKIRAHTSSRVTVQVTIPEGTEQDDIFELLESEGVCESWKLRAAAQYYDFGYGFMEDMPYTEKRLEGYLFPDTYTFYVGDDPVRVIRKFLVNFNHKITVDMKARAGNIGYSMNEIMIIASMIEKEAKFDDERPTISSVIHNRLKNSNFKHLQIDATVQYALPERKEKLTNEDLKIDSPYNTYIVEGLPVGAICNPGLAAIRAALYPEETDYYFYVARINGWHIFSKTAEEHQAAIDQVNYEIEHGIDEGTN